MRKLVLTVFCAALFVACGVDKPQNEKQKSQNSEQKVDVPSSIKVTEVKYEALMDYVKTSKSPYIVMNFWATWCVPCVKEMPYFFNVKKDKTWDQVEWVFVSLDEGRLIDTKVKDFLIKNNYTNAMHFLLNDNGRQQTWIDVISPQWSGSIPATALYHKGLLVDFHEGMISEQELNALLQKHIK